MSCKPYAWGDEFTPNGRIMANTYHGHFPDSSTAPHNHPTTMPVASYHPNGYGLDDMSGNVWEWTSDWYRADYYQQLAAQGGVAVDPHGPSTSYDPQEPGVNKRSVRGGSFLCTDQFCSRYEVGGRGQTEPSSSANHIGFRVADKERNMSWEAVTALGSAATAIVIVVTVIFGRRQLDELRRATQLEGAMRIFAELDSPEVDEARRFVTYELPEKLKDAQFRKEVELTALGDPRVHKELVLLRFFDRARHLCRGRAHRGRHHQQGGFRADLELVGDAARLIEIHRRAWAGISMEALRDAQR